MTIDEDIVETSDSEEYSSSSQSDALELGEGITEEQKVCILFI